MAIWACYILVTRLRITIHLDTSQMKLVFVRGSAIYIYITTQENIWVHKIKFNPPKSLLVEGWIKKIPKQIQINPKAQKTTQINSKNLTNKLYTKNLGTPYQLLCKLQKLFWSWPTAKPTSPNFPKIDIPSAFVFSSLFSDFTRSTTVIHLSIWDLSSQLSLSLSNWVGWYRS